MSNPVLFGTTSYNQVELVPNTIRREVCKDIFFRLYCYTVSCSLIYDKRFSVLDSVSINFGLASALSVFAKSITVFKVKFL